MENKDKLETLLKFNKVFKQKNWHKAPGWEDRLERFGDLINELNQDQISLLFELTSKYIWVSFVDYNSEFRKLLKLVFDTKLKDKKKRLFLFPIINRKDEKRTKSGHFVMKLIESIKPSINGFSQIKLEMINRYSDLSSERLKLKSDDFIILVDDYVGTGNTLNNVLKRVFKNTSINKDNLAIITLVIQNQAKGFLTDENIKCYNYLSIGKGITDSYTGQTLDEKIEIMRTIENKIPKVSKFRMGYEKSEALVTLLKTPNNTFPVFWKGIKVKENELEAPFQRY